MSETEGFIGRWSRLKRATATDAAREEPPRPEDPPVGEEAEVAVEPAVDLDALPPIESLTADSDYKPFLARGVPEELRRLALRKAWATNPQIANFRGFADYDWDCNAPGYGQLLPIDDVKRLCDAVLRPTAKQGNDVNVADAPAAESEPGPAAPRVEHEQAPPAASADPPVAAGAAPAEDSAES
jgi:hypothetical protein